jgi:hypothetical protein
MCQIHIIVLAQLRIENMHCCCTMYSEYCESDSCAITGCSEIGVPVHSLQTSRKESSLLKNDCSTVTDNRNLEKVVPDPHRHTYLKRGILYVTMTRCEQQFLSINITVLLFQRI